MSTSERDQIVDGVHCMRNFVELNDAIEGIDFVAKSRSLLYSIGVATLLRMKEFPKA